MDIDIDCDQISLESATSKQINAVLSGVDYSQLHTIVKEIGAVDLVDMFDDNTALIEQISDDEIITSCHVSDLLDIMDIDEVKQHLNLVDSSDVNYITLDNSSPADVIDHFNTGELLDAIGIDDIIMHFGKSAFSHLLSSSVVDI